MSFEELTSRGLIILVLVGLSQEQSGDVNTAEIFGVAAVCGGTIIIVCLIWLGICYGHYRSERDFCEFKKRLHQRREQYRRYWERQRQRQAQLKQQRSRRRPRDACPRNHFPSSHTTYQTPQRVMHYTSPEPSSSHQANNQHLPSPASNCSRSSPRGREPQSQHIPQHTHGNGATIAMQSQTVLSSAGQPSVPVGSKTSPNTTTTTYGHNSSQTVSSTIASSAHAVTSASRSTNQIDRGRNNRAYPKSVHFSRMPTQQTNSTLQQKTTGYTGRQQSREHTVTGVSNGSSTPTIPTPIQKVVLGRYSPKSLREEEEVDIHLESDSIPPPRYSWLFREKHAKGTSQTTHSSSSQGRRNNGPQDVAA